MLPPTCPVSLTSLSSSTSSCPRIHFLLSGTFNTIWLYLLAFSPYTNPPTLEIHQSYKAEGPHQFLALNEARNRVYATTWAQPPSLSSWEVSANGRGGIRKVNSVAISATGSYISVLPTRLASTLAPSHGDTIRIYQAGGPVAQTFSVSPTTGGFDQLLQEIVYLDGGQEELWDDKTDRTRVALRYGSHAVDIDPNFARAYIPHVGRDSIFVYEFNDDGTLNQLGESASFGEKGHEGPRHSIPSENGKKLYVITEHTSYLDVYDVTIASPYLSHSQRLSVIPRTLDESRLQYRGDTLRLSLDGTRLYVTTRGKTPHEKGYVSVWKVAQDGGIEDMRTEEEPGYGALHRYETKTSGGKANAIEVFPFRSTPGRDWIVLTDDEEGWVTILEWRDEWMELREIACVQLGRQEGAEKDEEVTGASHAVWLS